MVIAPEVVSVIPYATEEQTADHVKSFLPHSWTAQIPFQSFSIVETDHWQVECLC